MAGWNKSMSGKKVASIITKQSGMENSRGGLCPEGGANRLRKKKKNKHFSSVGNLFFYFHFALVRIFQVSFLNFFILEVSVLVFRSLFMKMRYQIIFSVMS